MDTLTFPTLPAHSFALRVRQRAFLDARATLVGFCGSRRCGKTTGLLAAGLSACGDMQASGTISALIATIQSPQELFRRAKALYRALRPAIEWDAPMLADTSRRQLRWHPHSGGPLHAQMTFTWASEERLQCERGSYHDFVGIDNLEFLTQESLLFLLSRLRNTASTEGGRLMATFSLPFSNTLDKSYWILPFFAPWFPNPFPEKDEPPVLPAAFGEVRSFVRTGVTIRWLAPGSEQFEPAAVSATIIANDAA